MAAFWLNSAKGDHPFREGMMIRALCFAALSALSLATWAQPVPVDAFFKRPDYSRPKLSPDGKHIAVIVPGPKRDALAIMEIDSRKGRPVTNFADADVLDFYWINDHRL